jgi:4-hydroxythreonine-4-phosphate dehydrogenase
MSTSAGHVIAITAGDPGGVGPELMARLVVELVAESSARVLLVSSLAELSLGLELAGLSIAASQLLAADQVSLLEVDAPPSLVTRRPSEQGGAWSLRALELAVTACEREAADGVVFGPLNKSSLHLAGMTELDELRWLERRVKLVGPVSEVNVSATLWTSRVTSHIPMRNVPQLITASRVADACSLLDGLLRADGRKEPRIAVCALNPHAGENGRFGDEETTKIAPGVALAKSRGVDASGPYPADTIFRLGFDGTFDGIVTMYHDQGQIALKTRAFDGGVTLEAGLAIPICTPAHGTAFDLVGTHSAGLSSMRNAYLLARRLSSAGRTQEAPR